MAERPPPGFETLCGQLAAMLQTEEGIASYRSAARIKEFARDAPFFDNAAAMARWPEPGPIGPWEPCLENGEKWYVRSTREQTVWSSNRRIGPKRDRKRVVLLGESVARGYFYDPLYTPAGVLESILGGAIGAKGIEVVDLARTDLGIHYLLYLARSALAFEPDALVLFAGNNWYPYWTLPPTEVFGLADALLTSGNWRKARAAVEKKLRETILLFLDALAELSKTSNVPILFVIPESNLADWRTPGQGVPFLSATGRKEWLEHASRARQAQLAGDLEGAAAWAERMSQLDCGTMATPLETIAEAKRRSGDVAAARRLFEAARDTALDHPISGPPACFSLIQNTLREEAPLRKIGIVDLPRSFEEYLGGDLPDGRLLLDYCHLNSEGIRLSMALAAEALLEPLGAPRRNVPELLPLAKAPEPRVEALASLLAANHSFNWGQSFPRLVWLAKRALNHDPDIRGALRDFADFHTRPAPFVLCASFERFVRAAPTAAEYHLDTKPSAKRAKLLLIDALAAALAEAEPGFPDELQRLREREPGTGPGRVDLLGESYTLARFSDLTTRLASHRAYRRCYDPESRFFFVAVGDRAVRLSVTYRMSGQEPARLAISSNDAGRPLAASSSWRAEQFSIPAEALRPGVNEISIRWPAPEQDWRESLAHAMKTMQTDLLNHCYPVFGEIAALSIDFDMDLAKRSGRA